MKASTRYCLSSTPWTKNVVSITWCNYVEPTWRRANGTRRAALIAPMATKVMIPTWACWRSPTWINIEDFTTPYILVECTWWSISRVFWVCPFSEDVTITLIYYLWTFRRRDSNQKWKWTKIFCVLLRGLMGQNFANLNYNERNWPRKRNLDQYDFFDSF